MRQPAEDASTPRALTVTAPALALICAAWLAVLGPAAPAAGQSQVGQPVPVPRQGPAAPLVPYGAIFSAVGAMSCVSPGNCAAGGYFNTGVGRGKVTRDAFVVGEAHGAWLAPHALTGARTLNVGRDAQVNSVSCASAGACAAGGYYAINGNGTWRAFVASEAHGHWAKAITVPGLSDLHVGEFAEVSSVSCTSPGNCSAGGDLIGGVDGQSVQGPLLVTEVRGHWRHAITVPGLTAIGADEAAVTSVSCAAPGDCAAGGFFIDAHSHFQGFVVNQRLGHWGKAIEVPGLGGLNVGGGGWITSLSCSARGDCAAGGLYSSDSTHVQAFVVSEVNGHWRHAEKVPGTGSLNAGGEAMVASVSCPESGRCSAGGIYKNSAGTFGVFVSRQSRTGWGDAARIPGLGRLAVFPANSFFIDANFLSLSCPAPGKCALAESDQLSSNSDHAFVASEAHGAWTRAIRVAAAAPSVAVFAISCAAPGDCAVGGFIGSRSRPGAIRYRAFVLDQVDGRWGRVRNVF